MVINLAYLNKRRLRDRSKAARILCVFLSLGVDVAAMLIDTVSIITDVRYGRELLIGHLPR